MSKTCMQSVLGQRGKKQGRWIRRRLPHVVADATSSGYDTCSVCGAEVYVGQGHCSPQAMQRLLGSIARGER